MAKSPTVLVVDDQPVLLGQLMRIAESIGAVVSTANGYKEALGRIQDGAVDVVVTDIINDETRQEYGLQVLKAARAKDPLTQVIVVTSFGNPELSVRAMDEGAFDYVERLSPGIDFEKVLAQKIRLASERHDMLREHGTQA